MHPYRSTHKTYHILSDQAGCHLHIAVECQWRTCNLAKGAHARATCQRFTHFRTTSGSTPSRLAVASNHQPSHPAHRNLGRGPAAEQLPEQARKHRAK
mmetsp:Transcript_2424/g.6790  ORF Transcript_2424/g.6790 Transcript_2424/m.6790 type:complete len:98 (+) Transcript_2424:181-474(+)